MFTRTWIQEQYDRFNDRNGWVHFNKRRLRSAIGYDVAKDALAWMKKNEWLDIMDSYCVGRYTKCYRLTDKCYEHGDFVAVPIADKVELRRLEQKRALKREKAYLDLPLPYRAVADSSKKLTIAVPDGLADELAGRNLDARYKKISRKYKRDVKKNEKGDLRKHPVYKSKEQYRADCVNQINKSIAAIANGEGRPKRTNDGRYYDEITNARKEILQYVRAGGEKLAEIDIPGSFSKFLPGILLELDKEGNLNKRIGDRTHNKEVAEHSKIVDVGFCRTSSDFSPTPSDDLARYIAVQNSPLGFYETYRGDIDRNRWKKLWNMYLSDDPGQDWCVKSPIRPWIRKEFPTIDDRISYIKRRYGYRAMSFFLRQAESDFVYNRVIARFIRLYPGEFIKAKHDAVITTERMIYSLRTIMEECFEDIGLTIHLTPKFWTPETQPTENIGEEVGNAV